MIIHPRLTKFSSTYTKGSFAQRFAMTEKINQKIFGNSINLYPNKRRNNSIDLIEECYNFCTPENKNVIFLPLKVSENDNYAGGTEIMEKMGMYVGYLIKLPAKNDKINIRTIPALMHESTHVLDFLLNPKFVKNDLDFFKSPLSFHFLDFYERFYYKEMQQTANLQKKLNFIQILTQKFIKSFPASIKINFLNFIRYSLKMEMHAYNQDIHYAKILKKLGKPVDKEDLCDYNKKFMFSKKIEIVEKILTQTLKEEREMIKSRNSVFSNTKQ